MNSTAADAGLIASGNLQLDYKIPNAQRNSSSKVRRIQELQIDEQKFLIYPEIAPFFKIKIITSYCLLKGIFRL